MSGANFMLFIHAQLLNLDKTIQSSMLNCLSVCVLWNNAGDCIHPSRGQSSHYCTALFKYDVPQYSILCYNIGVHGIGWAGIQYSYVCPSVGGLLLYILPSTAALSGPHYSQCLLSSSSLFLKAFCDIGLI